MLFGRKLEGLGSLVLLGEGKIQQLFVRKSTGRSSLWSRALGATPVAADLFVPVDRLLCDISALFQVVLAAGLCRIQMHGCSLSVDVETRVP